jgi:hypothetical protein
MATKPDHDLHDDTGRQQASEGLGIRSVESSPVAGLDSCVECLGPVANESGSVGRLCKEPLQMGEMNFADAVMRAYYNLMIDAEEAAAAIGKDEFEKRLLIGL